MYWNYEPLFTAVNGTGEVCLHGRKGREGDEDLLLNFLMKMYSYIAHGSTHV